MLPSSAKFVTKRFQDFTFYVNRKTPHGFPIKTAIFEQDDIINEVDDANLKEKLSSYQQFLVDLGLERAGHKVFNYAIENIRKKQWTTNLIISSTTWNVQRKWI